jgi:hypothetical protein
VWSPTFLVSDTQLLEFLGRQKATAHPSPLPLKFYFTVKFMFFHFIIPDFLTSNYLDFHISGSTRSLISPDNWSYTVFILVILHLVSLR